MKKILLFLMFALFCVPWAANAQDELTVYSGTNTSSNVPVYGLYTDTQGAASEFVIPSDSLEDMVGGTITQLTFYLGTPAAAAWTGTLQVYLGEVEATTLSGITGPSAHSVVYTGLLDATGSVMTVTFSEPYVYGGGNLLIGSYVSVAGNYKSAYFNGITQTENTGWYRSSASATGSAAKFIPKTTFTYTPGNVTCERPDLELPDVSAYECNIGIVGGSGVFNVEYKASSDTAWTVIATAEELSMIVLEGLTPATNYQVRLQSVCGEDPETGEPVVSGWKTTSFTTPCVTITNYPWSTNFDNVAGSTSGTTNNLPTCWNYINSSTYSSYKGYPIVYSASATAYSGNNYLRFYSYAYYNTSGTTTYDPQDQYAILPEMEGLDGKQISFFARGYNANSTFKVGLMTDPADASTFTAIATQALTTSYEEYTYDIQGEGNYIAIMIEAANASRTTNGVYIDDIKVADPPACPKPQSFVVVDSSVTVHTATLSWASEASAWQISIDNGEEEEIIDVEENPYTLTGLAPETTFTVKVRANCGTIVSEWSVEKNFTTAIACPAPTGLAASGITSHEATLDWTGTSESYNVMYRTAAYTDGLGESFGTSLPSGWENKSGLLSTIMNGGSFTTTTAWNFGTNNGVFDQHARINIYGTTKYGWLITPQFTVIEGTTDLSFDLALTAYSGTVAAPATTGTDDKFVVLVTTDNEASWTILRQWDNAGSEYVYNNIACSAAGEHVSINMDEYVGQNVRIAFYGESTTSNADNNLHIDNVSCGIYHEAGDWQSFVVDEASAQLTGLEGGTAYNAKLQGDCGVEGLSVETAAINFSTLPSCSAPAELTCTGVTTTTATFTWTTGDYPECQVEVTNNGVSEYYTANETPYTVEGLNPGTTYTVRVRPLCDTSLWSSTVTVITGFVVPLVEPFNTTSIPVGWSRYVGLLSGVMAGTTTLSPVTGIWTFGAGSNGVFDSHAFINIYGTSRDHWLVTPLVLMEDNVELSFDLALTKYSGTLQPITDTLGQDDKFVVLITNDNGASWQVLRQWDNTGSEYVYNNIACSATGEYVTIDLSSYAGQNVAIAFYGESTVTETGSDNNLHIDNVSINYIPTCPKPIDLSAEDITSFSATLSWSVSDGADSWNLAYKKVSDTVFTYVEGVSHPYVLEGLNPATTYEFYVIANCGQGGMSEPSIAYTFTTECGLLSSYPWSENFDSYTGSTSGTTNNLPVCWNYINTSTYSTYKGYPIVYNSSSSASSTPNSLRFYSYAYYSSGTTSYDPQDQYAILPEMEDLDGKIITMKVKGTNVNSTFYVGLMTDPTDASTFVPFATQAPTTSYEEYEFTIEGEGHYIAIKMDAANQSQTTHGIYVDDIAITFPPACPKPTNVTVYNIQPHIVTVGCESTYATEWEVRFDNDTIIYTNEMPYTLEDPILTAGATHTVEVHAYCGDEGAWSEWTNPISFTTACEAVTEFPWTEDFEEYNTGNFTTTCWQNEHIDGAGTQIFKITAGSAYSTGDNTSHLLQLPDMTAGTTTKLVLPFMTLPGDNYQFVLDVYRSSNTYQSNPYELEGIRVFASTNGEIEGATELAFIPRHYQVSNNVIGAEDTVGWYTYELPIGISGDCYIILRGESQYCTSTYMDNFVVEEIPTTNLTQTIALAAGTNWVSFNVETNLDDLKAALVATGNTAITIQGQTQNTTYNPNNGRWTGQLRTLNLSQMYIIELGTDCEITLEGMPIDPSMYPAIIEPGANYIAYPLNTIMTVTNAFAGFGVPNDQVQSQEQNANYNGARWTGQLRNLEPGKGYIYNSASTETRTFTFPSGN